MKKIFFSLLAIAAIASCAKTEPTFTEVDSEIKIAPVTAVSTKAVTGAIDGTQYPAEEAFKVFAYWNTAGAGSTFDTDETTSGAYLNNVKFVNKGSYWGGETVYYWPKNGSLRFAAYSPADLTMTHVLKDDVYTLGNATTPFEYVTSPEDAYDILVAPTSESYTAETAAEKVSVVFEHALSWISFKIQSTVVANEVFDVKEVIVNDVAYKGSLVANMTAGTKVWTLGNDVNPVTVFTGSQEAKSDAASIDAYDNLVLPQTPTTVTVKYTQKEMTGTPALENQKITVPLVLDNENDTWEPGKHYTYTILFDLDEILINPSVEDWEETTEVIVNSSPVKVATSAELVAAVAEGKDVVLEQNITLNEPVIVKPVVETKAGVFEVTIDLNGKDIVAPSTDAIVVDGGAKLTINGNGKVHAATDDASSANAVWIKHGDVVINGGDYYVGADGTDRNDCIYVGSSAGAANAASLKSSATIYGGTFESKVEADGQYWVLNLRDEFARANSTITVYGGQFKNFDPANNKSENPAVSFVAEGYGSYELEAGVWTVVSKTAPVEVANEAALVSVAAQGGIATLVENIELDASIDVYTEMTVNLNGKSVTVPANATGYKDVFYVAKTGKLTVNGKGDLISEDGYTIHAAGTAEVVLNDGYYFSPVSSVYATKSAVVTINGGTYEVDGTNNPEGDYGQVYTLNLKDDSEAVISVKGGSFYKFNPAESLSENPQTDFVAEGYKVLVDGDWYNVVAE